MRNTGAQRLSRTSAPGCAGRPAAPYRRKNVPGFLRVLVNHRAHRHVGCSQRLIHPSPATARRRSVPAPWNSAAGSGVRTIGGCRGANRPGRSVRIPVGKGNPRARAVQNTARRRVRCGVQYEGAAPEFGAIHPSHGRPACRRRCRNLPQRRPPCGAWRRPSRRVVLWPWRRGRPAGWAVPAWVRGSEGHCPSVGGKAISCATGRRQDQIRSASSTAGDSSWCRVASTAAVAVCARRAGSHCAIGCPHRYRRPCTQQRLGTRVVAVQGTSETVKTDAGQEVQTGMQGGRHCGRSRPKRDTTGIFRQPGKSVNEPLVKQVRVAFERKPGDRGYMPPVPVSLVGEVAKANAASKPVVVAKGEPPKATLRRPSVSRVERIRGARPPSLRVHKVAFQKTAPRKEH